MNKRIKFFISVSLIFALFVSSFCLPASSYENDVETSTSDILVVNTDTDTVVFSQKSDTMWYAGRLAELVTLLVADELIDNPEAVTIKVEKTYLSDVPNADGCLDLYVGMDLTAKDLMAIMVLTSGNDAAYALADLASGGDRKAFVKKMNDKVKELGCANTGFVSPGFDKTSDQYTTCSDLYLIYREVLKNELYRQVMDENSYTPDSLANDSGDKKYTVISEASILNTASPYYFRYTNDAKYSFSEDTYAGLVLTTTYRGSTYFFAGLLGLDEKERNIYSDAHNLLVWAYLNLSDRKLMNENEVLSEVLIKTSWGTYPTDLICKGSAAKTFPNEFDETKLVYDYAIPESVESPIRDNQSIGSVKITYDGQSIDAIPLVTASEEGLDILSDFARFGNHVLSELMPLEPSEEDLEEISGGKASGDTATTPETAAEKPKATEG